MNELQWRFIRNLSVTVEITVSQHCCHHYIYHHHHHHHHHRHRPQRPPFFPYQGHCSDFLHRDSGHSRHSLPDETKLSRHDKSWRCIDVGRLFHVQTECRVWAYLLDFLICSYISKVLLRCSCKSNFVPLKVIFHVWFVPVGGAWFEAFNFWRAEERISCCHPCQPDFIPRIESYRYSKSGWLEAKILVVVPHRPTFYLTPPFQTYQKQVKQ